MISKLIGQKIKEKREELNLAAKAVASELGISTRAYLDLEKGMVDIRSSKLIILKEVLHTSIASLFNEDNNGSYILPHNLIQTENTGMSLTSKEVMDKISELYERIITLENHNQI